MSSVDQAAKNQSLLHSGVSRVFYPLFLGQICSILLATCTLASTKLGDQGFSAPALQNTLVYFFLSLHLIPLVYRRFQRRKLIPSPSAVSVSTPEPKTFLSHALYTYFLLALFDFEANYTIVRAFALTSMTSGQILAGCTVPFVVTLRRVFLKARYTRSQLVSVFFGISGLALIIYRDYSRSSSLGSRALLGDLLALTAALLYASCNCLEERLLQTPSQGGMSEMLGMLGLFGMVIGLIQSAATLELGAVLEEGREWDINAVTGYLGLYIVGLVTFYHLLSIFMKHYDAAVFNLSILSSGVYAGLMERLWVREGDWGQDEWMYWAGVGVLVAACAWYHWSGFKSMP